MMCKRNERDHIEYKTFLQTLTKLMNLNIWTLAKGMFSIDENLFNDYSHDGFLTLDDFREMNKHLKFKLSPEEVFKEFDKNKTGRISKEGKWFKKFCIFNLKICFLILKYLSFSF